MIRKYIPEKSVMSSQNRYNYYLDYTFNPSSYYCNLKTRDIYHFIVKNK